VQVAKAYGAFVVTTCSPASRDLVSTLGADDVLDYRASPLPAQLKAKYGNEPFDLVFDTVGADPSVWHKCSGYLKVSPLPSALARLSTAPLSSLLFAPRPHD